MTSKDPNISHSLSTWMIVVIGIAILIITVLTITAILAGPPVV